MQEFWEILPGILFIIPFIFLGLFVIWMKILMVSLMVRLAFGGGAASSSEEESISIMVKSYDYDEDN
jgi:hypothetical protein